MSMITLLDLDMTLEPSSIEHAIREVHALRTTIKDMLDKICEELLIEGVDIARKKLLLYNVKDGPLMQSIKMIAFDKQKGVGFITAGEGLESGIQGMSYAIFVEKGTGKAKIPKKHVDIWSPKLKLVNGKQKTEEPEQMSDGKDSWVYCVKDEDGTLHYYTTSGQPPKPFMTDTYNQLKWKAEVLGRKYVAEYIFLGE